MKQLFATTMTLAMLTPAMAGVNVIDGDTVDIDGTRIRILSIDTPETFRSRCENELKRGLAAKQRLTELLGQGEVSYTPDGTDRYGRTLATVYVGDVDCRRSAAQRGPCATLRAWAGSQGQAAGQVVRPFEITGKPHPALTPDGFGLRG
jgi:hypothetical protein